MKKNEKNSIGFIKLMVVMFCAVLFFMGQKTVSLADSIGTVNENARVRQSADGTSEVVGGLTAGTEVTIVNEVTDASGTVWYEITSGNTKGFVRSDLINKSDTSAAGTDTPATTTTTTTTTTTVTAAGAEVEPETVLPQQYAKITVAKAIIRSKPSKSSGKVDSMPQNTSLIINGQTISDGGTWYYVVFTGTSGSEKSGYIRFDLIELGEMVPVEEPPVEDTPTDEPEAPVEEPVVNPDYEVVYEDPKGEGVYAWYLHDNTGETRTRQNLEDLLTLCDALKNNADIDESTISKQRIAIVILVAVIIIFAVVMTFMFFKLRDAYLGDDEDENYNWKADRSGRDSKERENRVSKDRESRAGRESSSTSRSNSDRTGEPVRRKSTSNDEQQPVRKRPVDSEKKTPAREVSYEEDVTERPKPAPKKKAKNFLADDDDFEFEFLNMKDKDKD